MKACAAAEHVCGSTRQRQRAATMQCNASKHSRPPSTVLAGKAFPQAGKQPCHGNIITISHSAEPHRAEQQRRAHMTKREKAKVQGT